MKKSALNADLTSQKNTVKLSMVDRDINASPARKHFQTEKETGPKI